MTYSNYLKALEMRAKWLQWSLSPQAELTYGKTSAELAFPMYRNVLASAGDTFFMTKQFCELVDIARREIPDGLKFDPNWLVTKNGFMWLESPFATPLVEGEKGAKIPAEKLKISAIAWLEIPPGERMAGREQPTVTGTFEFLVFRDLMADGYIGFECWSYFALLPGDEVLERVRSFEKESAVVRQEMAQESGNPDELGGYVPGRDMDMLHEVRWLYTALHLMSQKLASNKQHEVNRNTRRRMQRERMPFQPFYRVVTLRRLAEEQEKHGKKDQTMEWQWQWRVHGHGRWQWYPSIGEHKYIWIEDFIKGPTDKPMKPDQVTIHVASR